MASRTVNLTMDQGADFTYTTQIYANTSLLQPMSLTTADDSANAQMRKSHYHTNAAATFKIVIDGGADQITLSLAAANTSSISPGRYVYDVEYSEADGTNTGSLRTRVLEGLITVSPEVSK